jgi:hypothetical protein
MSYYEVFKPHPQVGDYISHIIGGKEARSTFLDAVLETSELKRLISPDLITEVRETALSRYSRYVKKRFKSEEEYPDEKTAKGMLTFFAYKAYLEYLFRIILGYYGIGSFYYIIFHRFANALYYRFEKNSPNLWGHEVKAMEGRMSDDFDVIKSIAKDKTDEVFLVLSVTIARLYYWLKYTGEGKGEIEAMIDKLSGVKRRRKKTIEEKMTEIGAMGESEGEGGAINEPKAQIFSSMQYMAGR